MTAEDKKQAARIRRSTIAKPKAAEVIKFAEISTIYFVKENATAVVKCCECGKKLESGDAYVVSTNGRFFKHKECQVDEVKQ